MNRLLGWTLLVLSVTPGHAQELEPRAYTNTPIGMNFLVLGFSHSAGSILTDPSLPIENVSNEADVGAFAFATSLAVLGQSAKMEVVIPSASLLAEGMVFGVPRERQVSGFGSR